MPKGYDVVSLKVDSKEKLEELQILLTDERQKRTTLSDVIDELHRRITIDKLGMKPQTPKQVVDGIMLMDQDDIHDVLAELRERLGV